MNIAPLRILCIVLFLMLAAASPALAYLDPSTGNFILQTVIAGFFGAYLFFKVNFRVLRDRIAGLFGGGKPEAQPEASDRTKE